jgi:hypothetical protein
MGAATATGPTRSTWTCAILYSRASSIPAPLPCPIHLAKCKCPSVVLGPIGTGHTFFAYPYIAQTIVAAGPAEGARRRGFGAYRTGSMRHPASGLRRTTLPRTPVNKRQGRAGPCSKARTFGASSTLLATGLEHRVGVVVGLFSEHRTVLTPRVVDRPYAATCS